MPRFSNKMTRSLLDRRGPDQTYSQVSSLPGDAKVRVCRTCAVHREPRSNSRPPWPPSRKGAVAMPVPRIWSAVPKPQVSCPRPRGWLAAPRSEAGAKRLGRAHKEKRTLRLASEAPRKQLEPQPRRPPSQLSGPT